LALKLKEPDGLCSEKRMQNEKVKVL